MMLGAVLMETTHHIEFQVMEDHPVHRVVPAKACPTRFIAGIDEMSKKTVYKPLPGGDFQESFLTKFEPGEELFDSISFTVWSPNDGVAYRILTSTVLEFHFLRVGTWPVALRNGAPLLGIYLSYGEEYDYWLERVKTFEEEGIDDGSKPICLEFDSPFLSNRKREPFVADRNSGLLVVCRQVTVEEDRNFNGPTGVPIRIPSTDE